MEEGKIKHIFGETTAVEQIRFYVALMKYCPQVWAKTMIWRRDHTGGTRPGGADFKGRASLMKYLREVGLLSRDAEYGSYGRHFFTDPKYGFNQGGSLLFRNEEMAGDFFKAAEIFGI